MSSSLFFKKYLFMLTLGLNIKNFTKKLNFIKKKKQTIFKEFYLCIYFLNFTLLLNKINNVIFLKNKPKKKNKQTKLIKFIFLC